MRILHVLGKLDRGGVETWLVQVLRHIDRQKYQMDFLVHSPDPGAYDEEVRALGSRVIPCLNPSNPAMFARNFRRVMREYGPYDVVHSHVHHYSGYVLMLAAMCGVPVRIAHSHNDTRLSEAKAGIGRKAYRAVMERLIRAFATRGLAVSTEAGDDLFSRDWLTSPRWKLQHLGIDLSGFDAEVDKESVRRSLGIPHDALVVGHVGRFSEQKNHSFFVDVAREVVSREPRAFFLMVGEGPLRPVIEAKVAACSLQHRFLFAGLRADVPLLMKGAMDILLFPSLHEGLPVTLLEAQAAGLRCLVSDAITRESDVVSGLVARQPLGTPASAWAERLLVQVRSVTGVSPQAVRQSLASRSILRSADGLLSAYSASIR